MVSIDSRQREILKQQDTKSYSSDNRDALMREFDQIDPDSINQACTAWSRLASSLGDIANSLRQTAGAPLAEAWESKTSPDAQQQLAKAQATAAAMADQAMHMARATDWAHQYAKWYLDHRPGVGLVNGPTNSDENALNDHRVRLLSRYNEVIVNAVPDYVSAEYVNNDATTFANVHKDAPGGTPSPGPGPGATPTGPGPGPHGITTTSIPNTPTIPDPPVDTTRPDPTTTTTTDPWHNDPWDNGSTSNNPYSPPHTGSSGGYSGGAPTLDTGSSLAGVDGGGGFGGGGGGLGGGLGAGGGGLGGADAAGAGVGSAGGLGGGAGAGAGLGAGAGAGGIAGGGAAGAGAGGAGRGGMMMPMHGSGQDGDDERERTTWLNEDEDIWGSDQAPPGVIS